MANSIMNSVHTVVMIGGFVVIFSVVLSILNQTGMLTIVEQIFHPVFELLGLDVRFIKPLFSGTIELTNGLNQMVHISTKSISLTITFIAFLLGFGGISVLLQVLSITSKSDISIKPYIIGKFLHGIVAAILTYTFIHIFPIFRFDLTTIFSQNVDKLPFHTTHSSITNILFLFFILGTLLFIKKKKKACRR